MTRRRPPMTLTTLEDRWTPAAGDPDFSYGTQGVYHLPSVPVMGGTSTAFAQQLVVLPDGRVVTVGAEVTTFDQPPTSTQNPPQLRASRLTADGRADSTFNSSGFVDVALSNPGALTIQPDGKVLVAGNSQSTSGGDFTVVRLTADGRLDNTFGVNGYATVPIDSGMPRAIILRPDGRVLVTGSAGPGYPSDATQPLTGYQSFATVQLTATGQPDSGFGTNGVAYTFFPAGVLNLAGATAVALQADGKVVLAGNVALDVHSNRLKTMNQVRFYDQEFAIARLNADGSPDGGFGDGGRARVNFGPSAFHAYLASAVQVRGDGRIVIAGSTSGSGGNPGVNSGAVAVLTPDGRLDPSFDGDGRAATADGVTGSNFSDAPFASFLPGDRVQFATRNALYRLTADGQSDAALGPGGAVQIPINFRYAAASPDGSLIVTAGSGVYRYRGSAPARFAPSAAGTLMVGGSPDGSVTFLAPTIVADSNSKAYGAVGGSNVYANFPGGVRTATADVNGDGVPDYVTGPGPGGGPNVVVTDGKTGAKIADLNAFETSFTGGVFVAAADLNGDGKADVVVTPDRGGGPVVVIYDGAGLTAGKNEASQLTRFFGIDDSAFRGGARPALGDVNGDGRPDLIVAAGFGGGPRVAIYNGTAVAFPGLYELEFPNPPPVRRGGPAAVFPRTLPPKLVGDFFVFEPTLRNGVFVAAGDLTGDGKAEVVVGGGPGGGPRVMAFDGAMLVAGQQTTVVNLFAGDPGSRGGVRVAVRAAADGTVQLVTGSGEGQPGRVGVYKAASALAGALAADQVISPFGETVLADGVFVG